MIPYLTGLLSTQYPPGSGQGRRFRGVPGLQVHHRARSQPASPLQGVADGDEVVAAEGGVQEHDIEGGGLALEPGPRIRVHHLDLPGPEDLHLLAHAGDGSLVPLHQRHSRRTPGRGLEAQCAAAGVEVQATGASDVAAEPVEQRLPDPIGGGAKPLHVGDPQQAATPLPGDDAYLSAIAGDWPRSLEMHKRDRIARGPGGGPDTFIAEKPDSPQPGNPSFYVAIAKVQIRYSRLLRRR